MTIWHCSCVALACVNCQAQSPGDLILRYVNSTPEIHAGPFVAVASGYEFVLGVKDDGTLHSYGNATPVFVPTGHFVDASACPCVAGWALALRADGSIGYWGQFDLPSISQNIPPGPFAAVAAGAGHAVAMRPDGTLVQWGSSGALSPPPGSFSSIAAGAEYSLGLRPDGSLEAWGTNASGVLNPPPGLFAGIAAGLNHAVAITLDGSLIAWGAPNNGALSVPPGAFVDVRAGDRTGLARRADGTVAGWGWWVSPSPLPLVYQSIGLGALHTAGIAGCYANCDGSTVAPTLNVADFTCFLQRFATQDTFANCDQSTVSPVLNVADFTCFLQRFAAGCP